MALNRKKLLTHETPKEYVYIRNKIFKKNASPIKQ